MSTFPGVLVSDHEIKIVWVFVGFFEPANETEYLSQLQYDLESNWWTMKLIKFQL